MKPLSTKSRRPVVLTDIQKAQALANLPSEHGLLAPQNILSDLYPYATNGSSIKLEPVRPMPEGFWAGIRENIHYAVTQKPALERESYELVHELAKAEFGAQIRAMEAKDQGTVVDQALAQWQMYDGTKGTVDPTGITLGACRDFAEKCEPLTAIINKLVTNTAQFANRTHSTKRHVPEPGFRVRMTNRKTRRTAQDEERIAELEQFIEECGYTKPPVDETPITYQPGFEAFLKQFTKDSFEMDWAGCRFWTDKSNPDKYPIVSFTAIDAEQIRRRVKMADHVDKGVIKWQEFERSRKNTTGEITLVKIDGEGGRILEEYQAGEVVMGVRRPRTDESSMGYGYPEILQLIKAINTWIQARDYNASRFDNDALPRGVLSVLANLNEQQFQSFQLNWGQMMKGLSKRWNTPVVRGTPGQGSQIQWIPFDESAREMEYQQFLFSIGLWIHAGFGMSPDETGFSAQSPFRPPLSEASPETNLKYSQDTCFRPYMRWLQSWINYNILWVNEPSRRYKFEFVGLGDYNETEEAETYTAWLNAGLATPRQVCEELDIVMPDAVREHPAYDFPAPFVMGFQLLNALAQSYHQQDQADAASQQQQLQAGAQQQAVNENPELAAQLQGAPGSTGGTGSAQGASPAQPGPPMAPGESPEQLGKSIEALMLDAAFGEEDGTMTPEQSAILHGNNSYAMRNNFLRTSMGDDMHVFTRGEKRFVNR